MMVASTNLAQNDTTAVGSGTVIRIDPLTASTAIRIGADTEQKSGTQNISTSIMHITSVITRFMLLARQ